MNDPHLMTVNPPYGSFTGGFLSQVVSTLKALSFWMI